MHSNYTSDHPVALFAQHTHDDGNVLMLFYVLTLVLLDWLLLFFVI